MRYPRINSGWMDSRRRWTGTGGIYKESMLLLRLTDGNYKIFDGQHPRHVIKATTKGTKEQGDEVDHDEDLLVIPILHRHAI